MIAMHLFPSLFTRTRCLFLAFLSLLYISPASLAQTNELRVFDFQLSKGLDMGVDSSEQRKDWVSKGTGSVKMSYPSGQNWGAVFITVGKPTELPRPSRDFSAFKVLVMELKGESGGEQVEVGIKTNKQPDDGSELKIPVKLTNTWKVFKFPLSKFDVDLRNLYMVTEFVFSGGTAQTVYFRGISYVANDDGTVSADDKHGATDDSAIQTTANKNSNAAGATENADSPASAPSRTNVSFTSVVQIISIVACLVFGGALLIILIYLLLSPKERRFSKVQQDILRLLTALAAAFLATFFVVGVLLDGTLKGFALSATGGFVIFILIFFASRSEVNTITGGTDAKLP